jgi:hypothetical protein
MCAVKKGSIKVYLWGRKEGLDKVAAGVVPGAEIGGFKVTSARLLKNAIISIAWQGDTRAKQVYDVLEQSVQLTQCYRLSSIMPSAAPDHWFSIANIEVGQDV